MRETVSEVQQSGATAVAIDAPALFRRLTLGAALGVVALEMGVFWAASRLVPMSLVEGEAHPDLIAVFIVFWTMLTLQATGAVGLGWVLVALGRTRLTVEQGRIGLGHPWRSWRGSGADVVELYTSHGWLHLRTRRSLRTWHVRGGDARSDVLDRLRTIVPAEAQLSRDAARRLMVARTVGPWLAAIAVGIIAFTFLQRWLESLR